MLLRHVLRTTEQQRNSFQPQARHHTDCLLQKISRNNSRIAGAAAGWVPSILSAKEHSAAFVARPMDAWHQAYDRTTQTLFILPTSATNFYLQYTSLYTGSKEN